MIQIAHVSFELQMSGTMDTQIQLYSTYDNTDPIYREHEL